MASGDNSLLLVPLELQWLQLLSTTLHIVREPKLHVGIISHPSWVREDKGWALGTQSCPTHWDRLASLDSMAVSSFSMIIRH